MIIEKQEVVFNGVSYKYYGFRISYDLKNEYIQDILSLRPFFNHLFADKKSLRDIYIAVNPKEMSGQEKIDWELLDGDDYIKFKEELNDLILEKKVGSWALRSEKKRISMKDFLKKYTVDPSDDIFPHFDIKRSFGYDPSIGRGKCLNCGGGVLRFQNNEFGMDECRILPSLRVYNGICSWRQFTDLCVYS